MNCPENNPLSREGISQFQRMLDALKPEYVRVDEREIKDLLELTLLYAKKAKPRFFQSDTLSNTDDWKKIMSYETHFKPDITIDEIKAELAQRHDFPPHFALLLCFFKLFEYLQIDINQLTKRHLDFYYNDVLKLSKKAAIADSVHVLFGLARNISETQIQKNTQLDAGKDISQPTPRPLTYLTNNQLDVNQAKIAQLKTVFRDTANQKIFFALDSKTEDGIKKPLPKDNPSWNAFGPKPKPTATCSPCNGTPPSADIGFPEAQIGFAVASNFLLLAEGTRTIILDITVDDNSTFIDTKFNIQLSGTNYWIEPKPAILTKIGTTKLQLTCIVEAEEKEKIVGFDAKKLDGNYQTAAPVMRCWLVEPSRYEILSNLSISHIKVTTNVEGLKKTLLLENDLGKLSSEKPFMPFGTQPVVGSTLYVGSTEAQQKRLSYIKLRFENWVGKPTIIDEGKILSKIEILNGNLKTENPIPTYPLFNLGISIPPENEIIPYGLGMAMPLFGTFGVSYHAGGFLSSANQPQLLPLQTTFWFNTPPQQKTVSDSLLKIRLEGKGFGHSTYTTQLTKYIKEGGTAPEPPYTPVASALILDYSASTIDNQLTNNSFDNFVSRDVQFFHLGVFGYSDEHIFLKKELNFLTNEQQNKISFLPKYEDNGTFFIGIQDAQPSEAISMLFQISEGSANPENKKATIKWSVLANNHWKTLNSDNILSDTTNQLLTSGIIKFYLPAETTTENTILEKNLVWLKAELFDEFQNSAKIDSVCNLIDIHTQAVKATFKDNLNDASHYDQPLTANTISKAREGLAAIKKIEQPYNSFGGQAQETEAQFYRRISERLRHKQRAVSIWDYEHLVLQQFPNIHKIKCLNHTKLDKSKPKTDNLRLDQLASGYVTVVVVPDLTNQNAVNKLEPKVDLNTLDKIKAELQSKAGKLVSIETSSPDYEAVRLKFKVRFKRDFPFSTYKKILNTAIIEYLSPWIKSNSIDIPFGGMLEKSVVINFIERLGYVDVLTDFVMLRNNDNYEGYEEISASNPMAVLVSCQDHCISELIDC